ncbi:MAG TPA: lamin tail domain-containing protein [Candidatus Binatia bacterium]|nr:lamin tail domain-containing protein [Candidatus Binatia bacterium]
MTKPAHAFLFVFLCFAATPALAQPVAQRSCARQLLHAYSRILRTDLRVLAACSLALESGTAVEQRCRAMRTSGTGLDRVTRVAIRSLQGRCDRWPRWMAAPDCQAVGGPAADAAVCAVHAAHCLAARAAASVIGEEGMQALREQHPDNFALELGGVRGNSLKACFGTAATTTTVQPTTTTLPATTTTLVAVTTTLDLTTTTLQTPPTSSSTTTTLALATTTIPEPTTTLATVTTSTTVEEGPTTTTDAPTTTTTAEPTPTTTDAPATTTTAEPTPTTTNAPATTTTFEPTTTTTLPPLTTTTSTVTTSTLPATTTTTLAAVLPDLVITEIGANPEALSDASGEYFEIHNAGAAPVDLLGLTIKDNGSDAFTVGTALSVPAGAFVVFGRTTQAGAGQVDYVYGTAMSLTNTADAVVLVWNGIAVDAVAYGSGFPLAAGASMSLRPGRIDAQDNDLASSWCRETAPLGNGDFGSPRAMTAACGP